LREDDHPLGGAEQARPLPAQAHPKSQDDRSAYLAEGTGQPIQVATRTLGSEGARGSVAFRDGACRASIAAGAGTLGWSQLRLMDL